MGFNRLNRLIDSIVVTLLPRPPSIISAVKWMQKVGDWLELCTCLSLARCAGRRWWNEGGAISSVTFPTSSTYLKAEKSRVALVKLASGLVWLLSQSKFKSFTYLVWDFWTSIRHSRSLPQDSLTSYQVVLVASLLKECSINDYESTYRFEEKVLSHK